VKHFHFPFHTIVTWSVKLNGGVPVSQMTTDMFCLS